LMWNGGNGVSRYWSINPQALGTTKDMANGAVTLPPRTR
jgi:hypothetical protein